MAMKLKSVLVDIFIWDAETKNIVCHINDFHRKAITALEFSIEGTLLLTAGQDDENSIAIYDWQGGRLVASSKVDTEKVNSLCWKSNTEFMTAGDKHVKLWTL